MPQSAAEQLKSQIEKLNIPNEQIQTGLKDFVSRNKYTQKTSAELTNLIDSDPVQAIIEIAGLNPFIFSPRSPHRSNEIRKELVAHASNKTLLLEAASPLMPLGTSAHCLREMLDVLPLDTIINNSHHQLIFENDQVIGFQNSPQEKHYKQGQIPYKDPKEMPVESSPKTTPKTLFEFPLPAPKANESQKDWVLNQLKNAFKNMKVEDRDWPTKPNDIEKILENGPTKVALVTIMEICHYVFDNCGQMSVTAASNSHLEISTASIEQFRALNWLSIASNIINLNQKKENVSELKVSSKDEAFFIELPIGKLPIITGDPRYPELTLNGGEIDSIVIKLPNLKEKIYGLTPENIGRLMEKEFNNQSMRYHKKNEYGQVTKNKLGRNLGSCFHLLSRYFGDDFIDHIEIVIKDYKFLGGDGGWRKAFDKNSLPLSKHESQIKEYLILALGQLYLVYKENKELRESELKIKLIDTDKKSVDSQGKFISNSERKIPAVTLEELLVFAQEKKLFNRITGQLCYQIPGQEVINEVKADDYDSWQRLGKNLISERVKDFPEYQQRSYLRLLKNAIYPKEILDKSHRENNKLPDNLSWGKYLYQNYILIKEFSQEILDKKIIVKRSAIYKDGVIVLWIKHENKIIRLAFNQNCDFSAVGFDGIIGKVSGSLSSNIEMVGVRQRNDLLLKMFYENIVDKLDRENLVYENQLDLSKNIIGPDGKVLNLVPGKPIVASVNHMNGYWYLNTKLLQKIALDDSVHTFYLHKLSDALGQTHIKNQPVMCPLPTHPNHTSPAAFLYGDHIKCFGGDCGETTRITDSQGHFIKHLPMESSDTPAGYREVTPERQRSIKSFFDLTVKLNQNPEIVNYLIHLRGLSPNEIGQNNYSYFPLDLSSFISNIADYEFKKMGTITNLEHKLNKIEPEKRSDYLFNYAKGNHDFIWSLRRFVYTFPELKEKIKDINIEDFSKLLNDHKIFTKTNHDDVMKQCLGYYVSRSPEHQEKFNELIIKYPEVEEDLRQLRFIHMEQWHQRGLIGKDSTGANYMGGRIIFPTKWISGLDLQSGNICARGISDLEKKELFEGPKHRKAFLGPIKKRKSHDLYTHPTPPGIWLPSPENFMKTIAETKKIILLEGPITTASFVNIFPEYRDNTAAVIGFPIHQLPALLKWFGVHGYESNDQHFSKNLDIQEIVLGTDFDKGGTNGFINLSEVIRETFPDLIITPIHDIIPDNHPTKKFLRPYDPTLYEAGGLFEKEPKIDWNDILLVKSGLKKSWLK